MNEEEELIDLQTSDSLKRVTGMYKDWFLDYASYVILERAVPAIEDGLKPVQRPNPSFNEGSRRWAL